MTNQYRDAAHRPAGWWFIGIARIVIGVMWFQQTLWKLPPHYDGLRFWLGQAAQFPKYAWYKHLLDSVVLPHFEVFAFQAWLGETFIAVSLVFGLFARLGGLLSGLMAINLLVAMSGVPHEWYWTYLFIAVLGFIFCFTRAGRYLGVDQALAPRIEAAASQGSGIARIAREIGRASCRERVYVLV